MRHNWKLVFGIFCALVLIAVGLLRVLEKLPVTSKESPSAEAQRNRFLAAQRLLTALEVPWQEIRGLPTELPTGPGASVVWPSGRGNLPRHTLDAVERFVESGGHLIVEAGWWESDLLLERFGIALHELDLDYYEDDYQEDDGDTQEQAVPTDEVASADCRCDATPDYSSFIRSGALLGQPELWLELHGGNWLTSELPPLASMGPPEAPRLLHLGRGAGRITVVTGLHPFTNDGLGAADNAEALMRLIDLPQQASSVLFVRPQPGGLGDWLRTYAWRVIAAGALLLLLALWSTMPRFGPIAADPQPKRRRLLDHLLASGRLLWRHQQQAVLATAAAQTALDRVRAEYPHTRWLPAAELGVFLQRRFAFDSGVIALLLAPEQVRHPASMTTLVRACTHIHNELAPRRAARANSPLYDL